MSSILSAAVSLASVLIIGNLLILAHELGHYGAAARALGITARRFVIGFGLALARYTSETATPGLLTKLPAAFLVFAGLRGDPPSCRSPRPWSPTRPPRRRGSRRATGSSRCRASRSMCSTTSGQLCWRARAERFMWRHRARLFPLDERHGRMTRNNRQW